MFKFLRTVFISLVVIILSSCMELGGNTQTPIEITSAFVETVEATETTDVRSYIATPTRIALPTKTIVVKSPKPTPSITPLTRVSVFLTAPMLLQYTIGGEVYLEDMNTGMIRPLSPKVVIFRQDDFLGWKSSGCSFVYRTQDRDIIEVDLHGSIVNTLYSVSDLSELVPPESDFTVSVSPLEDSLTFIKMTGERLEHPDMGLHYENENVFLLLLKNTNDLRQVSQNGGAWISQMSNDGQFVAYTDYDAEGRFQIFVYSVKDNKRTQISFYSEQESALGSLSWSPDNLYIAKTGFYFPFDVEVLDVLSHSSIEFQDAETFWWEQNHIFAIWKEGKIQWFSATQNEAVKILKGVNNLQSRLHPISTFLFGCFNDCFGQGERSFTAYNVNTKSIVVFNNAPVILDKAGWSAAPESFSNEELCEHR
jgi:hypothetical protein